MKARAVLVVGALAVMAGVGVPVFAETASLACVLKDNVTPSPHRYQLVLRNRRPVARKGKPTGQTIPSGAAINVLVADKKTKGGVVATPKSFDYSLKADLPTGTNVTFDYPGGGRSCKATATW